MLKTKIVCTIGPACKSETILESMINSGMNVARLNFSHGSHEEHLESIDMVKKVREKLCKPVALMQDTRGPEIRIKSFKQPTAVLEDGKEFTLTTRDVDGNSGIVSVTYADLPSQLHEGCIVLIDDGSVELRVKSISGTDIICEIVRGDTISSKKGINIPRVHINMTYLSEQDKKDVLFGVEHDIDFIAASFVRNRDDVICLRKFIDYHGGHDIKIISKIENLEGIENFDEILKYSDGIMVARGDMGVEVEYERLPGLQKRFIRKCYQSGKMVITATQMLESMINKPTPTRAEITDVANAVFDGTSAIMLSGETAMGKYPIRAVEVMANIAEQAEKDAFEMEVYKGIRYDMDTSDTTNAVCDAACTTARDINAKAIIALTKYGNTARRMSKFRPFEPIIAATPVEKTYYQLAMSWGVYPVLAKPQKNSDDLFLHAIDCAKQLDAVVEGDMVVIAAGIPLDISGNTNLIKVEVVGKHF
ncbi:MAG: pyruvate kinase [Oscillospiraceae bacterium]